MEKVTEVLESHAFRRDHGPAAMWAVIVLVMPAWALLAVAACAAGLVLALPGIMVALVLAIPHWIRARSDGHTEDTER
jgi:hypothetical protein